MAISEPWLRLYIETIDDEKLDQAAEMVGCPYDTVFTTWSILLILAKKSPVEGYLIVALDVPITIASIAKKLRRPDELELVTKILDVFEKLEMLTQENGCRTIAHWDERQFKSDNSTDRWRKWMNKRRNYEGNSSSNVGPTLAPTFETNDSNVGTNVGPTAKSQSQSHINSSTTTPAIPKTPREAQENPTIQLYQKVTSMFPPEKDYKTIVETILLIQNLQKTDDCGKIEAYLIPFWAAWRDSKRVDGQPYDPRNITWLVDWAVTGKRPIQARGPTRRGNGNGKAGPPSEPEPTGVEGVGNPQFWPSTLKKAEEMRLRKEQREAASGAANGH